jgi:hypothetical protein
MKTVQKPGRSAGLGPFTKLLAVCLLITCLGPATAAQTASGPVKVFILAG